MQMNTQVGFVTDILNGSRLLVACEWRLVTEVEEGHNVLTIHFDDESFITLSLWDVVTMEVEDAQL